MKRLRTIESFWESLETFEAAKAKKPKGAERTWRIPGELRGLSRSFWEPLQAEGNPRELKGAERSRRDLGRVARKKVLRFRGIPITHM